MPDGALKVAPVLVGLADVAVFHGSVPLSGVRHDHLLIGSSGVWVLRARSQLPPPLDRCQPLSIAIGRFVGSGNGSPIRPAFRNERHRSQSPREFDLELPLVLPYLDLSLEFD